MADPVINNLTSVRIKKEDLPDISKIRSDYLKGKIEELVRRDIDTEIFEEDPLIDALGALEDLACSSDPFESNSIKEILPWLKYWMGSAKDQGVLECSTKIVIQLDPDWAKSFVGECITTNPAEANWGVVSDVFRKLNEGRIDPATSAYIPDLIRNLDLPDLNYRWSVANSLRAVPPIKTDLKNLMLGLADMADELEKFSSENAHAQERLKMLFAETLRFFNDKNIGPQLLMTSAVQNFFDSLKAKQVSLKTVSDSNTLNVDSVQDVNVRRCVKRVTDLLDCGISISEMDKNDRDSLFEAIKEIESRGVTAKEATPWLVSWVSHSLDDNEDLHMYARNALEKVNPDIAIAFGRKWIVEKETPLGASTVIKTRGSIVLLPKMIAMSHRADIPYDPRVYQVEHMEAHPVPFLKGLAQLTDPPMGYSDLSSDLQKGLWEKGWDILRDLRNVDEPESYPGYKAGFEALKKRFCIQG